MPKLKTKSSVKKRFGVTGTGKLKRNFAKKRHCLFCKTHHKKIFAMAKGYRGRSKNVFRVAVEKVEKALQYAYRDRRAKKRSFRSLWIQRIGAAARLNEMTYSRFMNGLNKAGIELDRKVLADIALKEPEAFAKLVAEAKDALK